MPQQNCKIGVEMSTRKSRQNTDSPTPYSGSTESVASTPSTPSSRPIRSVRKKPDSTEAINIKSEKIDDDEEPAKGPEDDDKGQSIAAKRKRRIATAKDESATSDVASVATTATTNSDTSSPQTDDGKTSPNKMKRSRRSAVELPVKEEDTPRIGKRRNSTGKIEQPARKLSSRIKKLTQMRKINLKRSLLKKPEKVNAAMQKPLKQAIEKLDQTKATAKKATVTTAVATGAAAATVATVSTPSKTEKTVDSASDSELLKISRRRSDSVSKCSDMTDTSSFQELKETDETIGKVDIKQEAMDKDDDDVDSSQKSNETEDKRTQRRLRRKPIASAVPQKIINTRSRSETPNKLDATTKSIVAETDENDEKTNDIKSESAETASMSDELNETLPTEKASDNVVETKSTSLEDDEQATKSIEEKSMSPVLVSEGVSEISVKQFYGRADFLENNLGIEKDPKLGEMVQVHEKIKSETSNDENASTELGTETPVVEEKIVENATTENDAKTSVEKTVSEEKVCDDAEMIADETSDKEDAEKTVKNKIARNSVDDKVDAAKIDDIETEEINLKARQVRKDSASSLINENLLLNGEIEVRPTEKKSTTKKAETESVSDVVLYKITNGIRANPEKLETVLESQKQKEKDESKVIDDVEMIEDSNDNECNDIEMKADIIRVNGTDTDKSGDKIADAEKKLNELKSDNETTASTTIQSKQSNEKTIENADKDKSLLTMIAQNKSRSSSIEDESLEDRKQKESHLKTLGLLTHQAAEEAAIEKQKRREQLKASIASSSHGSKGKKNAEYTGTLKTVIKLHRSNNEGKKKGNQSLKMTLHKGRAKNGNGNDRNDGNSAPNSEEDTYYIQSHDIDGMGKF